VDLRGAGVLNRLDEVSPVEIRPADADEVANIVAGCQIRRDPPGIGSQDDDRDRQRLAAAGPSCKSRQRGG
jgi:hypothetical protein